MEVYLPVRGQGCRWEPELQGKNMELRLVYFANEFNKQVGNGVDMRKFPKAMAKLKKQVKHTKEIISENIMASISVESLCDDPDFRWNLLRNSRKFLQPGIAVLY
ncbi:hypothetical protein LguiA_036266 [Lonicera macranthoides]